MVETRMLTLVGKPEGNRPLGNAGVYEGIRLKWIL
jgi:hypothetical protein